MEQHSQTRRRFLQVVLGLGSLELLRRYLTPRSLPGQRVLLTVRRDELPAEGALVFRDARIALVRTQGHLTALSLVCTHLGCTVNVHAEGLSCPCHGSRFDRDGMVLEGPAVRPLGRYRLEEQGEKIMVLAS